MTVEGEDFAANIQQHYTTPFVWVREIAQFGDWNALACMPPFIVLFSFEKSSNVAMNKLLGFSVHCLVGLRGDAIEARDLSRF